MRSRVQRLGLGSRVRDWGLRWLPLRVEGLVIVGT